MSKTKHNKLKQKIEKNAPVVLIVLGAFFVLTAITHWFLRYQALSLDAQILAQHVQVNQDNRNLVPAHLYIQWFVDVPISEQVLENNNWTISETEASYLQQSAKPGEKGNIIIYGHNTRAIMGNIRALKGNEIITITTEDGKEHQYKIVITTEVNPDETQYLLPTEEETLTLYTCSGFLDRKRFIVQAKPIQ